MTYLNTLKTVREQRHLAFSDVADAVGISPKRLSLFENGEREPSFLQLERLSEVYGVPVYLLASDHKPNLQEVLPDFRKPSVAPAHISAKGLRKIWSAEYISELSFQLAAELEIQFPSLTRFAKSGHVDMSVALALRQEFDAWFSAREKTLNLVGTNEQRFLAGLRMFVESNGTIVNINEAPSTDYYGFFSNPQAGIPIVFVNRKILSKKAQIFTLAHEICHCLIGKQGISNPFLATNEIETLCNKFAAEFIAPISEFQSLVELQTRSLRSNVTELVAFVSQRTYLSGMAAAIRLSEAGYLSKSQVSDYFRIRGGAFKQEKDGDDSSGGPSPHAKQAGELGYLPVYIAALAIEKKIVDKLDIASTLGISENLQPAAFSLVSRRLGVVSKQ